MAQYLRFYAFVLSLILSSVVRAEDQGAWTREPWRSPLMSEKGLGLEIRIKEAPAGVAFRQALDPSRRYRLQVDGEGGPFTMRLQIDQMPPEYLAAPAGPTDRVIAGASLLEVLFYSDTPAAYSLKRLELQECPACKTAEDLRQRILAEAPEAATATGLEKAIALLKWSANAADYTAMSELTPADFESWPVERAVYDFFDQDLGGVSCGGHAVFFRRILHLFGIDAFTINYGIPGTYVTHVTVVAPVDGRFYLLDPSFALTFLMQGRPAPIDEALNAIRAGKEDEIEIRELGLDRRDVVAPREFDRKHLCDAARKRADGLEVCKIGSNSQLSAFTIQHASNWEAAGVRLDHAALFRLMFKGLFGVGPSLRPQSREEFLALMSELEVPMHPQ